MGKKKVKEMQKHRGIFIEGAEKNGVPARLAEKLFEQMVKFAEYCLSYDTLVLTVEHGPVPIGRLVTERMNCRVYSRDRAGHLYAQPIAQWHARGQQEVFEYTLDDGSTIRATPDHEVMTADGKMYPIDEVFARGLDLLQCPVPVMA